ncbi:histidine kinase [Candidatus Poribacteria bacterium]|nr:MAG: histidine kinase [Candidatus Poribacteria bacterium]
MFSGVITEIYKKVCESTEKKHYELKADIGNASHEYNKNYRERHGQVKVFCVGMRKPIPLDDVYVGVQFLDEHTASRYRSPEEVEQEFRDRSWWHFALTSDERQDGKQVANDEQYLMLLGGPGVGKSTFLRKVGLESLKGKDGSFAHECIPVFLELKRFTEEQIDIEVLITQEFETCGYPYPDHLANAALKSGKLLILFDGLDEVPTANVDNVIRKIGDFVDQYSQNRFIASCRTAIYRGGFTRFTEVEMADFDDSQIETYIKNWFDSTPHQYRYQLDKEMKTAEQCWKALNTIGHHATKELARNPLLLTLLCMVYDNSQNFPQNRADLYEKALSIFIEEWAAEKRIRREESISQYLDIAAEKRMLSEIAAKNFEVDRLFFGEGEILAQIREFGKGNANTPPTFNASKILETILVDQGLFVERVRGSYSFSHLTFQEYLTANYIVRDTRSIRGLVKKHLHNEQWREVFLLTSGLMHEADDLLVAMEAEAAKSINTDDKIKLLLRWAERITDTTDNQHSGLDQRAFAINQYLVLNQLNKFHEKVKYKTEQSQDSDLGEVSYNFHGNLNYLSSDFYIYDIYGDISSSVDIYKDLLHYRDLYPDLYLYCNQAHSFDAVLLSYYDFYHYLDVAFHSSNFSKFGEKFDRELSKRIKVVRYIKETKIFEGVDLQRMVQRFNEEQEFIKAAGERKSVKPPAESIHDTWLSVLGITNDMLIISDEELESCLRYLRAVKLIVACKEAAGRVSPKVWQKIEEKLLVSRT